MIYVLDTDILTLLAHEDSPEAPRIRQKIRELPPENFIVTTVVNYEEQIRGWMAALARARSPRAEVQVYDRLLRHLGTFRRMIVLAYNDAAAEIAAQLRRQRVPGGAMDRKIAAIVLANGAVLVTRNIADFRRVPNLHIEDWTSD